MVFKSLALAGPRTSWTTPSVTYLGIASDTDDTTAEAVVEIRAKGTNQVFSNLTLYSYFNTADAAIVFTFRKNGVDGNQTISVPAGTTGYFQDAVNTDSVSTGDDLATEGDASAPTVNGMITSMIAYTVEDDSRAVTYLSQQATISTGWGLLDGVTRYAIAHGYFGAFTTSATGEYLKVKDAYLWDNLRIYIITNDNNDGQTFDSYINGAGGNQTISVLGGATGRFEDTVNSDQLASGDNICIRAVSNATGGSKYTYLRSASSRLSFDGGSFVLPIAALSAHSAGDPSGYSGIGGGRYDEDNRGEVITPIRDFKVMLDRARVYVSVDDATDGTDFTVMDGATDTPITINAKSTGWHENNTDRHIFEPNTNAAWRIDYGSVESQYFDWLILRGREVFDASKDLFCEFNISQVTEGYADLFAKFLLRQEYGNLFAKFEVRQTEYRDIFAKFEVQAFQPGVRDLYSEFILRRVGTKDLYAKLSVRRTSVADLTAEFGPRRQQYVDFTDGWVQVEGGAGNAIRNIFGNNVTLNGDSSDNAAFYKDWGSDSWPYNDFEIEFDAVFRASDDDSYGYIWALRDDGGPPSAWSGDGIGLRGWRIGNQLFYVLEELPGPSANFLDDEPYQPGMKRYFTLIRRFTWQYGAITPRLELYVYSDPSRDPLYLVSGGIMDIFNQGTCRYEYATATYYIGNNFAVDVLNLRHVLLPGLEDVKAELIVRHAGAEDLLAELVVRHTDAVDLAAQLIVRHSGVQELYAQLVVQHTIDLLAEFIVKHTAVQDLAAELTVRHSGFKDLYTQLVVQPIADLKAIFTVRHSDVKNLFSSFGVSHWVRLPAYLYVRHPYWLWSSRRYIEGVIDLGEIDISDAVLEYVIEGVMVDVKSHLITNQKKYDDAWTIISVPKLIKRAVTYGVVASLYARGYFDYRLAVSIPPRTITVIPEDRNDSMAYWENKMEYMLGLYYSSVKSIVLWVDTWDEEPVFSMEEIPLQSEDVYKEPT